MGDFKKMKKVYEASDQMMKRRMSKTRKKDLETLKSISDNEVIVVRGTYDRVEDVLDIVGIPYGLINQIDLDNLDLRPSQTLIINCPAARVSKKALKKIKKFVKDGGFLFSTDWVLLNVLQKIFPEYVKYNEQPTGDDVVKIEIADKDSPYLEGLFESKDADPQWWLEGSSYPIKILKPEDIKILIRSREMKKKYGEDPIVITFEYGEGTVFHMTSHYYLQRTELRSDRHKSSAMKYVQELNLSAEEVNEDDLKDIKLGEMESAYTSAQFLVNTMVERKKKINKQLKKKKKKKK